MVLKRCTVILGINQIRFARNALKDGNRIPGQIRDISAICLELDLRTGLQCLTEVNPENRPLAVYTGDLQGIVAVKGDHIQGGIPPGILAAYCSKEPFVAFCFEVNALEKVTNRLRFFNRFTGLEIIHIDLQVCRAGLTPAVHIAHQIHIFTVFCQHNRQIVPAIVEVLVRCTIGTGINQIGFAGNTLKYRNRISFRVGNISAVCLEADHSTGLQGLAEIDPEDRPLAVCTGDLQCILAAVCRCGNTGIRIGCSCKDSISPGILAANCGKQCCVTCYLEADSLYEIALGGNRLGGDHIVDIHCTGSSGNNPCPVVVPEQIHIGCCLRQGDGQLCPLIVLKLYGSLAAAGKFKDALIIECLALDGTVCHKGDLGTCRQSLAEVHSEGGPIEAVVAQLHQMAAAIFRHGDPHIIVGHPINLGMLLFIIALSDEIAYIADDLKVQTLVEIAHRGNGLLARCCDHIVDVHLSRSRCRSDLCPVIVPEQINIFCAFRQLHLQLGPLIALELIGSLTACRVLKDALIEVACTAGNPGISLECDDGSLRQRFTKVNTEGGPEIIIVAQSQGVFAAACQAGDIQIGICHSFNGGIPSFITLDLLTGKESCISGDLKIQTQPEVALRLNGRNGIRSDHIVDQHMTGSFIGGDSGTFKVPEQIHIAARFLQCKALLRPAITGGLNCCFTAGAEFEDALVIQALTVNPRIGIEADDGACR